MYKYLHIEFENMLNMSILLLKYAYFSDIFNKFASRNLYCIMGIRLNKAMTILNIGTETVVDYLKSVPGLEPTKEMGPNTKLSDAQFEALQKRFSGDILTKSKAKTLFQRTKKNTRSNKSHNLFNGKEVTVFEKRLPLKDLKYENHRLFFQMGTEAFVLLDGHAPAYVKSDRYLAKENDLIIVIRINRSKHSFTFEDEGLLSRLNLVSFQVEKEMKDKQNKEREEVRKKKKQLSELLDGIDKPLAKKDNKRKIRFSQFKFENGSTSVKCDGIVYEYKHPGIKGVNTIIDQYLSVCSDLERSIFNGFTVTIIIKPEKKTFIFYKFDLINYCRTLKNKTKQKEEKTKKANDEQKQKALLCIDNIEFHDGFYYVWIVNKGQKNLLISPLRVTDLNSYHCLCHVHKYFSDRFPKDVRIIFNEKIVIGLSKPYLLSNYVRILHDNMNKHGDWWEDVQKELRSSNKHGLDINTDEIKKKASLKNGYLDNLISLQNDKKLIPVKELFHGNEEEAFIFSVDMPNDKCAVVFENALPKASRATWVFVTDNENYEDCIKLVGEYFINNTTTNKRLSLRKKGANPPEKFMAESYTFIDHNDLGQWLKKLNRILENKPQPSDIAFVPGLNIPQSSDTRSGHGDAITTKNLHNELMRRLYDRLCSESGKDNVGTEIHVGAKRIDAVVKGSDFYDLYEVKTALNPFDCVTEALGQLCQYAYLFCRDKIGKMVIAGVSEPTKEVEQYLATLRKNHSLQVHYIKV